MTQKIVENFAETGIIVQNKLHEDERQVLRLMLQVNKFDVQNFLYL